jgi:hypothetical protein
MVLDLLVYSDESALQQTIKISWAVVLGESTVLRERTFCGRIVCLTNPPLNDAVVEQVMRETNVNALLPNAPGWHKTLRSSIILFIMRWSEASSLA